MFVVTNALQGGFSLLKSIIESKFIKAYPIYHNNDFFLDITEIIASGFLWFFCIYSFSNIFMALCMPE